MILTEALFGELQGLLRGRQPFGKLALGIELAQAVERFGKLGFARVGVRRRWRGALGNCNAMDAGARQNKERGQNRDDRSPTTVTHFPVPPLSIRPALRAGNSH